MDCIQANKCFLSFVLLSVFSFVPVQSYASRLDFTTEPVPMTTTAQKEHGIEGGEGFQQALSIAFAPSAPSRVYLSSDMMQVWRSEDGGYSWAPCNAGYRAQGASSLFVHPNDSRVVFAAGTLGHPKDRFRNEGQHQGIYRTLDGGDTWDFMATVPFYRQKTCSSLFALDSRTLGNDDFSIYAGGYDGNLYFSRDSGGGWAKTGINEGTVLDLLEHPGKAGALYLCTVKGLFFYENNKVVKIGSGLPQSLIGIAVSKAIPNRLYAVAGKDGIYVSNDNGQHFEKMKSDVLGGAFTDIEASPADGDHAIAILAKGRGGPFFTHDGGRTWHKAKSIVSKGLTRDGGFYFPSPLALHPINTRTALTCSNGRARVLRTEDGGRNWFYSGSGYSGGRLHSLESGADGKLYFGLMDHGLWVTENSGVTFRPIELVPFKGQRSVNNISVQGSSIAVSVGTWTNKEITISRDMGRTWKRALGIQGKMAVMQFHRTDPQVLYAGRFRSDNQGRSWNILPHEIAAIYPGNNDILYSVSGLKGAQRLRISYDRGQSWCLSGVEFPKAVGKVRAIVPSLGDPGDFYVSTFTGLWRCEAGRWKKLDTKVMRDSFHLEYINQLVLHPTIPGVIFAGKKAPGRGISNGLWYSSDWGSSWNTIPLGAIGSNTSISYIGILPGGDEMYVGTSHGIYKVKMEKL